MNAMKKFLVVAIVAIMGVSVANAGLRFGIRLGTNVDHVSANLSEDLSKNNRAGFTGGLMLEYMTPLLGFGFDLGLQYAYMNSTLDDSNNFLQIPLNLKYKIGLPVVGKIIAPYIFTGPSFDFKLDKNTVEYFKQKTFQTVWNVGLGLEFVNHLQIGASYGFGMNTVAKYAIPGAEPVKFHNNYWTITAAYLF